MKTTMSQGEKWRQYGVMVHDTPETLAGMLRIQNGNGDAVAFAIDHETAKTITNAVNCHDDLLEACKSMLEWMEFTIPNLDRYNVPDRINWGGPIHKAREAITRATRATTQKEGAK